MTFPGRKRGDGAQSSRSRAGAGRFGEPTARRVQAVSSPWRAVAVASVLSALVLALVLQSAAARPGVMRRGAAGAGPHSGLSSLTLRAQGTISGVLGAAEHAYRVSAAGGGYRASNPAQGLQTRFGRSGVLVETGAAKLGLSLSAVGYGASLATLGGASLRARANRVEYKRPGLSEWYANGPLGVEQGFTIAHAPAGHAPGPLTLALALSGDTRAALSAGGGSLTFSGPRGSSLRYGELLASDARGRALHSWLELRGGLVLLRVDARGARYPLRIDPFVQQGPKIAGVGFFGCSVALSADGNTALIGAENADAAWVFTRTGSTWSEQAKLTGSGASGESRFGTGVALSADGNTALVGGEGEGKTFGAAWVFTRSEGKWTQQGSALTGGKEESGAVGFGAAVALSAEGSTALIGDYGDSKYKGAAWVFTRSEGKWTQQGAKLTGGKEEVGEGYFGNAVALGAEGNTALIGAKEDNGHVGAAWAFTRSEGKWTQQGSALTGGAEENKLGGFGSGVALSTDGNTALIGAYGDSTGIGAAWVFTRKEGKWTQQGAKLTGGKEEVGAGSFGSSVALSSEGNVALIGAEEDNKLIGAVWVFTRSEGKWTQQGPVLTGGTEESGDGTFGSSVALSASGETALIGGAFDNSLKGAAWVFTSGLSSEEGGGYGSENEGEPDIAVPCGGVPVNCASGNEAEIQTDLAIGGHGPGLRMTRTYNSQLAAKQSKGGPFGFGWTGTYGASIVVNEKAETATVDQDNGSSVMFTGTPTKAFLGAGPWVQATLVKSGSSYVYTLPDQTKLVFNSAGQQTSEVDRDGNAIALAYNTGGQLETATDGAGRKLTFAYNGEGQVESIKDPMGHVVKYTYKSGELSSVTLPGESKARWEFGYDSSHQLTGETDGRGNTARVEYEGHRVTSWTDFALRKRQYKYAETESGTEASIAEPNGSTTVMQFDSASLPTSVTEAAGTPLAATSVYAYNGSDELETATDPDEHTTAYGYDSGGDLTSVKDPNGNQTKWTYNGTHDVATMTTPKGETTTIKRDPQGDPETIERPAPSSQTQEIKYTHNNFGDVTSYTNPLGKKWTYEFDKYGDPESETDPESGKRTNTFNEDSQETSTVSPIGNVKGEKAAQYTTKVALDALGRPLVVTDPLGHQVKYTYDGNGNVEALADGNNHTTGFAYNADNQQTTEKLPKGTVIAEEYDNAGEPIVEINGDNHATKEVRNLLEEVTKEADPLGRETKAEYDPAGQLKKLTDAAGRTTTYIYDPGGRLTEVRYSETKMSPVKRQYDKEDSVTAMTDGTGTTTYTYNQLEQLTNTINGNNESVGYGYNLAGEQTELTYPNKDTVTRGYDNDERLQTVTDWLGHETKFSYNPNSDMTAIAFPSATGDQDKYAYNEDDQLSEINMTKGTESLASLLYTRDNDGQLKKAVAKGLPGEESTEYEYDTNNRLTKAGSTEYGYDGANNPLQLGANSYTYNSANELETGAGGKYTFNEVGERTKNTPASGAATSYGYDQAGNLTSVERPEESKGTKTPKIEDTYAYDGNGLRASQTSMKTTTHMAWDTAEETPSLLYDGTNSYVYGPGGLPIEQINGKGEVLYLHHDQQGSTRMLTGSTGKNEGATTYDSYGNVIKTTGTATTPLGYDGQYTNSETGLIYLKARSYEPKTAQFVSVDPAAAETGETYSFVGDDPLNEDDPSGEQPPPGTPPYPPIITADPGTPPLPTVTAGSGMPQQSMSASYYLPLISSQDLDWVQNPDGTWGAFLEGTRRWFNGRDYYWYEPQANRWHRYGTAAQPGAVIGRGTFNNEPAVLVQASWTGPFGGTGSVTVWIGENQSGVWVNVHVHTAGGALFHVRVWVRRPR
jgi:RHS repeat-associated protein